MRENWYNKSGKAGNSLIFEVRGTKYQYYIFSLKSINFGQISIIPPPRDGSICAIWKSIAQIGFPVFFLSFFHMFDGIYIKYDKQQRCFEDYWKIRNPESRTHGYPLPVRKSRIPKPHHPSPIITHATHNLDIPHLGPGDNNIVISTQSAVRTNF